MSKFDARRLDGKAASSVFSRNFPPGVDRGPLVHGRADKNSAARVRSVAAGPIDRALGRNLLAGAVARLPEAGAWRTIGSNFARTL